MLAVLLRVLPLVLVAFATAQTCPGPVAPNHKNVLVIGIDGCRPDALAAANTPNLDALIAGGVYSGLAQTGDITVSGPGWSSCLCGVWRDKHGVTDNSFVGQQFASYPHFFEHVRAACPSAFLASIAHWAPINTAITTAADLEQQPGTDAGVAAAATTLLTTGNPDVLVLHFDDVDAAGHGFGFSPTVPQYLQAIQNVDAHVGTVLAALAARAAGPMGTPAEDWLIVVTTDHGGLGTGHGGNTPEQRTIFLIASGASAGRGTISPAPEIVDVPATVFAHLGLAVDPQWGWDGRAVQYQVGCPSGLQCRPDHLAGSVALTWTVDPAAPGSYELRRDGAVIAMLPSTTSSYLDVPGLLPHASHVILDYELVVVGAPVPGACPTLRARALLSTGQVVLADDFEDYASDAALIAAGWTPVDVANPVENATWSVTNPGSRAHPPEFDGRAGRGRFVISDSDWGGSPGSQNPPGSGMSHDLWSPTFDCTQLAGVWLHADCAAQLNDNGDAVFDVDVSTSGGATWTNVWRRVPVLRALAPVATTANADGFFGRLHVDLSAVAAGQPSVRVRLRHFEPSWDWWIAVDNLLVDDVDAARGGAQVLLAREEFPAIPASWTLRGLNGGTETWHTTDKGNRYNPGVPTNRGVSRLQHPGPQPDFAILDSSADPDPAENELLITPAIDCRGWTRVFLHAGSELLPYGGAVQEVLLSIDGGVTFLEEPLFSYSAGALVAVNNDPFFTQLVLEAEPAAGQASVAFAFRFQSAGNRGWWAVDDVTVTADDSVLCPHACGDCDPASSAITILDALAAARLAVALSVPTPLQTACCDVNSSGGIEIIDALMVAQVSAGLPVALMCP